MYHVIVHCEKSGIPHIRESGLQSHLNGLVLGVSYFVGSVIGNEQNCAQAPLGEQVSSEDGTRRQWSWGTIEESSYRPSWMKGCSDDKELDLEQYIRFEEPQLVLWYNEIQRKEVPRVTSQIQKLLKFSDAVLLNFADSQQTSHSRGLVTGGNLKIAHIVTNILPFTQKYHLHSNPYLQCDLLIYADYLPLASFDLSNPQAESSHQIFQFPMGLSAWDEAQDDALMVTIITLRQRISLVMIVVGLETTGKEKVVRTWAENRNLSHVFGKPFCYVYSSTRITENEFYLLDAIHRMMDGD
ncbi:hypothetical protein C8J56DRAFT_907527 [Mycena floridula]|nr:hypothetical protein C8J56DRAFT_907527 [Mycena floridula]